METQNNNAGKANGENNPSRNKNSKADNFDKEKEVAGTQNKKQNESDVSNNADEDVMQEQKETD